MESIENCGLLEDALSWLVILPLASIWLMPVTILSLLACRAAFSLSALVYISSLLLPVPSSPLPSISISPVEISNLGLAPSKLTFPVVRVALGILINPAPLTVMPLGFAMMTSARCPATSTCPLRCDLEVPETSLSIREAEPFLTLRFPPIQPAVCVLISTPELLRMVPWVGTLNSI